MVKRKSKKDGLTSTHKKSSIIPLSEVDKTFYELTINDIKARIQRLKTLEIEFETKNEELEKEIKNISQEQKNKINYHKRIVNNQNQEIAKLHDKILSFRNDNSDILCQSTIKEIENEYKTKQDQLTSEIKVISGQISSLEEFKSQKDELMEKFKKQQCEIETNKINHKREMYETQKKFCIGQNQLKKDMELNLLQMSTDFQKTTTTRITTTTHRVIRENIAITNDLGLIIETNDRLLKENVSLKNINQALIIQTNVHKTETNDAIAKSSIQLKLLAAITQDHLHLNEKLDKYKGIDVEVVEQRRKLEELLRKKETLEQHIRMLEQNLHASKCNQNSVETELQYANYNYDSVSHIIYESMLTIKSFLKESATTKFTNRQRINLIKNLLTMMTVKDQKVTRPSIESVQSLSNVYREGDLGFEPITVALRSIFPLMHSKQVQMGPSFDQFVKQQVSVLKDELVTRDEGIKEIDEEEEKKENIDTLTWSLSKEALDNKQIISIEEESILFGQSSELSSLSTTKTESTSKLSSVDFTLINKNSVCEESEEELETEEDFLEFEEEFEEKEEDEEEEDEVSVKLLELLL